MNKLILFDIDNTLFDTQKYSKTFVAAIAKEFAIEHNANFEQIAHEAYKDVRQISTFDPDLYATALAKRLMQNVDIKRIVEIIVDEKNIIPCLFPEVATIFEKLLKLPIALGILSSGRTDLQQIKTRQLSHLMDVEHIHITQIDKREAATGLFEKYKNFPNQVIFVDDLFSILQEAKRVAPNIITVWSKRGRHAQLQENHAFKPDYTISSLEELLPIVG